MWQLWPGTVLEGLVLCGALVVILDSYRRACGWAFGWVTALVALTSFWVIGNAASPVFVAGAGVALALRGKHAPIPAGLYIRELAGVFAVYGLYTAARYIGEGDPGTARLHALDLLAFERALGLDFEVPLQDWLLDPPGAMRAFSAFYSYGFLATVAAMLVYLYVADRRDYRIYRNALGLSVVLAAITLALYPVAPPRLVPESGLIDTVTALGREHAYSNEYAAMPSLHVGWMVLTGYMLGRRVRGIPGLLLGAAPGLAMGLTVVATGNHYWVDGAAGAAYALGPALLFAHPVVGRGSAPALVSRSRALVTGLRAGGHALASSARARFSALGLGGLLLYLVVAQLLEPGFTNFWGYLTFQVAATLTILLAGEIFFRQGGGLSWTTHVIAVATSYADVLGTDGNLYARIDEYDKLTHFLGVAAVTAGAYDILGIAAARGWLRALSRQRALSAVAFGVSIGFAWEVYEFLGDRLFNSTRVNGRWDTFNDLVFDTVGALVVAFILARPAAPGRTPEPAATVPSVRP